MKPHPSFSGKVKIEDSRIVTESSLRVTVPSIDSPIEIDSDDVDFSYDRIDRKEKRKIEAKRIASIQHTDSVYFVDIDVVGDYSTFVLPGVDPDLSIKTKGPMANLSIMFQSSEQQVAGVSREVIPFFILSYTKTKIVNYFRLKL